MLRSILASSSKFHLAVSASDFGTVSFQLIIILVDLIVDK